MTSSATTSWTAGQQVDLEFGRPNLPEFLPDETLYSWAARVHRKSGHASACDTSRVLFKHRYAGLRHDFPFSLRALSRILCNGLEDPNELAWRKTIVPFFLIMKAPESRLAALESMHRQDANTTRLELSLRRTRFPTTHPLKRCPECMSCDIRDHQTTYWHREHQWPGIVFCHLHGSLLQPFEVEKTTPWLFQLVLPQEFGLNSRIFSNSMASRLAKLSKLSGFIRHWSNEPQTTRLGLPQFRKVIRKQIGLPVDAAPVARLQLKEVAGSFLSYVGGLSGYPELAGLPTSTESSLQLLARLVDDRRHPGHPLGMISLISWAFPSWESVTDGLKADATAESFLTSSQSESRRTSSAQSLFDS